ncbi:MAG: UDP-glucose 4-epimerase GalE [Chloroflexota bacterium]
MNTPILVTGGAGYIGSHTCKALASAGFCPVTFDNLVAGNRWSVKWGPLVHGDLSDRSSLEEVIYRYGIEAVIHFAAYAYVGESMQDPGKYFQNNVVNTVNLLEALKATAVRQIVFSSTCAVYGVPERIPISEDHATRPINPYGESKLFIERALSWYGSAHGFRSVSLRYFNAAGADPDGDIGESHDPETHLMPLVIQAALGKRPHLTVYGSDYPTPDGTAIRDYIHVTDLAEAHVQSLTCLLNGGESATLNLGTGTGHSVREVISAVERLSGKRFTVIETARRPGDPPVLIADATRSGEVLHWSPRFSSLESIVKTAWRWHERAPDTCGTLSKERILATSRI